MNFSPKLAGALAIAAVTIPAVAGAVTFLDTLNLVNTVLNAVIPMLITLALIYFFWGLIQYIGSGDESKEKARDIMIYGILSLFVMVSVWGIIRLLQSTFKVTSTDPIIPKAIQLQGTSF
jgi:CHASE3 domain sensor protein